MSHATVAVTPAFQALLTSMGPALAATGAGFVLTAAAVMAARKLREDFQSAHCDFAERCRQDQIAATRAADKQALNALSAATFGAAVEAGSANTTAMFLERVLCEFSDRARAAGRVDLAEQAVHLHDGVAEQPAGELLAQYFALADRLETESSVNRHSLAVASLRAEMALSSVRDAKLRAEIDTQLARLETVSDQGSKVAMQGVENLRARLRREIAERSDLEHEASEERRQRQEAVAEAYAMIRAVLYSGDPDEQDRARMLLGQLGSAFQGGTPSVSDLQALLSKSRALFERCEKRLQEIAAHAYLAESVKDVLLGMGYQVSDVPDEIDNGNPGCMVPIDAEGGVVVSIAPDGRMLTEMVAFSEHGVSPSAEDEKKVCAVVDAIMAGLRNKSIPVQEKSRKKLRPGHMLRIVKRAKAKELTAAAAQKARAIEGPNS